MSYKKETELSPSLFKRRYGVSLKTFWKMVEVVRNAKQESRGSHAKLSISDQILMALQYWREYRTYFHIALILGNPWSYSISDSQENWRHFKQSWRISLAWSAPVATIEIRNRSDYCWCCRNGNWATPKKQKHYYSGKQKCHTLKMQLIINQTDKSVICTEFGKGRQHDFRIFKNSKIKVL